MQQNVESHKRCVLLVNDQIVEGFSSEMSSVEFSLAGHLLSGDSVDIVRDTEIFNQHLLAWDTLNVRAIKRVKRCAFPELYAACVIVIRKIRCYGTTLRLCVVSIINLRFTRVVLLCRFLPLG